jgi:hypothetical protein
MAGDPLASWAWGLSLIASTMVVHATGLVVVALVFEKVRGRLMSHHILTTIVALIATVGLLLVALHVLEAGLWAAAYWGLGAIGSPADAILYSIDSISTRGGSGLMLERRWQTMGALEALDGMLLFGISTAFLFAIAQDYWSALNARGRG